ncbi:MAG: hypothetical protein LBU64_01830 [Planctomycetota bacterium]|jgi:hypothetical protein|nr:hypothetical protein [Planctomycetota bacterium]
MPYTIDRKALAVQPDIFRCRMHGRFVYVKKRRRRKNPLGRLAQGIIYRFTGNPLVRPPPGPGADSVAFESGRLEWLAERGIDVPRVMHRGEDYFVMSDAGPGLDLVLSRKPGSAGNLIPRALAALRRLHGLGEAHGGAQIRNLTWSDSRIHFIDFEDDIDEADLAAFQLRDVFLFIFSLECLGLNPDIADLCRSYDAGGEETGRRLCAALGGFAAIRPLNFRLPSPLGMRDIRAFISLVDKAERLTKDGVA